MVAKSIAKNLLFIHKPTDYKREQVCENPALTTQSRTETGRRD